MAFKRLSLVLSVLLLPSHVLSLWPAPKVLQTGTTALKVGSSFNIHLAVPNAPADLVDAVSQAETYLQTDKLQRLVIGRGAADNETIHAAKEIGSLTVELTPGATVRSIATEAVAPIGQRSDEYTLSIPEDGSAATLKANSTLGLFRGLTTFGQLWYYYAGQTYTLEAPIDITDYPAYPYRGFMLDTARNFFPVSDIKRTLDAMSWVKINTLHWHITDAQSWPLEVKAFPELALKGAYSTDDIYSTEDIQDIVSYAGARGIDVLLEIDTPGHTAAIVEAYPQYVACYNYEPWTTDAAEPPSGQIRFASSNVTNFIASVFSDVASTLPSTMFSTGGDELNTECYQNDTETQEILNSSGKTLTDFLNDFTETTHGALIKAGKTPVVWEEMVLSYNVTTLSNDTIVMVWISSEDAAAVADLNYRIVHSPSNYFYLDCGAGDWLTGDIDGTSWCDPFKSWQKSYSFDPLANITTEQIPLVLGGQHLLWAEQSGPENLDPIVWPRAASSAEVFWTGATLPDGNARNVSEALPRLHDMRFRMVQRGVNAIPLQPLWCALRPGMCVDV